MGLADQCARAAHRFGNPLFYSVAGSSAFTDLVDPVSTVAAVRTNSANNEEASAGLFYVLRTMDQTLSLQTSPGWEDVTGLGTPAPAILSVTGVCR
jgi:hypothetical protein